MNVPTTVPTPRGPIEPAAIRENGVVLGPIRECAYCGELTPTHYARLAYRCPDCGHAAQPIDPRTQAAFLDELLARAKPDELGELARRAVLRVWELDARRLGVSSSDLSAWAAVSASVAPPNASSSPSVTWASFFPVDIEGGS
jgi:hypothetical protein